MIVDQPVASGQCRLAEHWREGIADDGAVDEEDGLALALDGVLDVCSFDLRLLEPGSALVDHDCRSFLRGARWFRASN